MIRNQLFYNEELNKSSHVTWIPWEKLDGTKILITGASGMIGSYIVDVLMTRNSRENANITVYALGRTEEKLKKRFSKWNSDSLVLLCADVVGLKKEDIPKDLNYIIHAASNTHPREYASKPVDTIKTNLLGLMNLLDSQVDKEKRARILVLSSVEIYGENNLEKNDFVEADMGYIDSNTLRAGYPESKRLCESMLQAYRQEKGIQGSIVRLSRVYGPGIENDDTKAMTQFILNAINGEDIVLKSSGEQVFSYCYVADASLAILKVMLEGEDGEAYNVASKKSDVRLKDIAKLLADNAGTSVKYEQLSEIEKKGVSKATRATLDYTKYKNIGGKSEFAIEKGLKATLEMMKIGE